MMCNKTNTQTSKPKDQQKQKKTETSIKQPKQPRKFHGILDHMPEYPLNFGLKQYEKMRGIPAVYLVAGGTKASRCPSITRP
jgi:hypothetical protein